jgi:hypothetical protein
MASANLYLSPGALQYQDAARRRRTRNLQQLLLSGLRAAELTSAADRAALAVAMMNPSSHRVLAAD